MSQLIIDDTCYSWHDFLLQAWNLPLSLGGYQRAIIQTDDPKDGLLLMLACLLKGKSVVLDPKKSLTQGLILTHCPLERGLTKKPVVLSALKKQLFRSKAKACLFFAPLAQQAILNSFAKIGPSF